MRGKLRAATTCCGRLTSVLETMSLASDVSRTLRLRFEDWMDCSVPRRRRVSGADEGVASPIEVVSSGSSAGVLGSGFTLRPVTESVSAPAASAFEMIDWLLVLPETVLATTDAVLSRSRLF